MSRESSSATGGDVTRVHGRRRGVRAAREGAHGRARRARRGRCERWSRRSRRAHRSKKRPACRSPGLTALQALREVAALKAGQRVLIQAGAGGVGSLAIQIAQASRPVGRDDDEHEEHRLRALARRRHVVDYTKNEPLPTRARRRVRHARHDASSRRSRRASAAASSSASAACPTRRSPASACPGSRAPALSRSDEAPLARRGRGRRRGSSTCSCVPTARSSPSSRAWIDAGTLKPVIASHVSARRGARGIRRARARPRARQDRRDDASGAETRSRRSARCHRRRSARASR